MDFFWSFSVFVPIATELLPLMLTLAHLSNSKGCYRSTWIWEFLLASLCRLYLLRATVGRGRTCYKVGCAATVTAWTHLFPFGNLSILPHCPEAQFFVNIGVMRGKSQNVLTILLQSPASVPKDCAKVPSCSLEPVAPPPLGLFENFHLVFITTLFGKHIAMVSSFCSFVPAFLSSFRNF